MKTYEEVKTPRYLLDRQGGSQSWFGCCEGQKISYPWGPLCIQICYITDILLLHAEYWYQDFSVE
jgi:hypothetical protein